MRYIAYTVLPTREYALFEQAILHQPLRHHCFQSHGLLTQILDCIGCGFANSISSQTLLPGLQKLLQLAVIQILINAFLPTQCGNTVFTA